MPLFFMYSKATHTREIKSSTLPPSMLSHCLHHKTAWLSFFLRFFFQLLILVPNKQWKKVDVVIRWKRFSLILSLLFHSPLPLISFLHSISTSLRWLMLCLQTRSSGSGFLIIARLLINSFFLSLFMYFVCFHSFVFDSLTYFFLGSFFILFFISSLIVCWWAGISSSFLVTFSDYASRHLSWLACSGVFYRGDFLISK